MDKFCAHCGSALEEKVSFCPNCGAPVNKEATPEIHTFSDESYNTNTYNQTGTGSKSKIVAGLLGIFLGGLGVHNFYLGFNSKAIAQLLITILSCGFLGFISAIWGLVEGILILTGSINVDANGVPLTD